MIKKNFNNPNDILNSIERIERAKAPDFFYTRLKARMDKASPATTKRMLLQPAFIISGILLLLLMNIVVLVYRNNRERMNPVNNDNMQSIVSTYYTNYSFSEE